MKEIVTTTYVADTGIEFDNWEECFDHELNYYYFNSGVKFYYGRKLFKGFIRRKEKNSFASDFYEHENEITRITVDRSKEEQNKKFAETFNSYGCCCDITDALLKNNIDANGELKYGKPPVFGTEYRFVSDGHFDHLVCVEQLNACPCCGETKTLYPYKTYMDEWEGQQYEWMCRDCWKKEHRKEV